MPGSSPHTYVLPKTEIVGTCAVTIEIPTYPRISDETSSWTSLGLSASQLIHACHSGGVGVHNVGGWVNAGDNGYIKITIENKNRLRPGAGAANASPKIYNDTIETS